MNKGTAATLHSKEGGQNEQYSNQESSLKMQAAAASSARDFTARQQMFKDVEGARVYALMDDTSEGGVMSQADIFRDNQIRPSMHLSDRLHAKYSDDRNAIMRAQTRPTVHM